jgi:hypothetical protein
MEGMPLSGIADRREFGNVSVTGQKRRSGNWGMAREMGRATFDSYAYVKNDPPDFINPMGLKLAIFTMDRNPTNVGTK